MAPREILLDPADSPNAVTLVGSPPKLDMFFLTLFTISLDYMAESGFVNTHLKAQA